MKSKTPRSGAASPEAAAGNSPASTRRNALGLGAAAAATALIGGPAYGRPDDTAPLVLKRGDFSGKTGALFKELSGNPQLQAEFVNNPSKLITQRIAGDVQISPQRLSNANRVLFAAVSNNRFHAWATRYASDLPASGNFDKGQITRDFAGAIVRFSDVALVQGLMEESELLGGGGGGPANFAFFLLIDTCVCIIDVVCYFIGLARSPFLGAAELRSLTERLVVQGRRMQSSGDLTTSFVR